MKKHLIVCTLLGITSLQAAEKRETAPSTIRTTTADYARLATIVNRLSKRSDFFQDLLTQDQIRKKLAAAPSDSAGIAIPKTGRSAGIMHNKFSLPGEPVFIGSAALMGIKGQSSMVQIPNAANT